jgi:alpha-beta hydrolase superfamily lysophospholipase
MGQKPSVPLLTPEAWAAKYAVLPSDVTRAEELVDGFSFAPAHSKRNLCTWMPSNPSLPPKALVFIIHGIHEHILRYNELAIFLVRAGYAVAGLDHYGHGKSEGPVRGSCSDGNAIVEDVARAARHSQAALPAGLPTLLLAHSGGTLAAVRVLELGSIPNLRGAFFSALALKYGPGCASPQGFSSLYWLSQTAFGEWLMSVAARLDPHGGAAPLLLADLTTQAAEVLAIQEDPLRYHGMFRNALAWEGLKLIRANRAELARITLPIALHHAREDRIVLAESTAIAAAGVSSAVKVIRLWDGVKHEMFHDSQRAAIFEDVAQFFEQCLQGGQPASSSS